MTSWIGPTPTVRPIQFVTDMAAWRRFYVDLGLKTVHEAEGWTVLAAASGMVALHAAQSGGPLADRCKLGMEVADLAAYRAAVEACGLTARGVTLDHGEALEIEAPGLGRAVVDHGRDDAGSAPVSPDVLSVISLVRTDTVRDGAASAARLGWQPRISGDAGGWADLVGHGILAFHAGVPGTVNGVPACEVSFETGELEPLLGRVREAGHLAHLIDEAYGRTLRIAAPGGTELWVNETQRDLYGYHLAGSAGQAR